MPAKRVYKKRAPKKVRMARSLTTTQKAEVKALVKAPLETKYVSNALQNPGSIVTTSLASWTGFTSGITGVGEIYPAIPKTQQGVGDYNRIGDNIQPTKVQVHLDITGSDPLDDDSYDRTVYVFLLTSTSVKSLANYTAIPITQLLHTGSNSGSVSFDGTALRSQLPVNHNEFRVLKKKVIRLQKSLGLAQGDAISGLPTPSRSYAKVVLDVTVPSKFKYENGNQNYPTNSAPFVVIGWHDNVATNAAPNAAAVQVIATTHMWYKDA